VGIKVKHNYNLLVILFIIITAFSCKDDNPVDPPQPPVITLSDTLTLSIMQETHRSISVNIKSTDNKTGKFIELRRFAGIVVGNNYTLVSSYSASVLDTTIIDDNDGSGLELDTEYGYYAVRVDSISKPTDTSNVITAKTLTATSHDFTAQIFTFGDFSSSVLNDVAIIDENDIWAVGTIFLNDSTGQNDGRANSLIKWDGHKWISKRIFFNNNSILTPRGISILNSSNIYFASGSIFHWNGISDTADIVVERQELPDPNATIGKLWLVSSKSIYGVGNRGTIVHYNGSQWKTIPSGTDLALTDIYSINEDEIYICGVDHSSVKGIILKGNSNSFATLITSGIISNDELFDKLYGTISTVWLDNNGLIYTGGSSVYLHNLHNWDYLESAKEIQRGFIYSISGNAGNDFFMVGDRNTLVHYNGIDCMQIGIEYDDSSPIVLFRVKQKGDIIAAVGFYNRQAIIIILKR
jgi:hypothetical protein